MKFWAFQGRFAGLVSIGKTVGILLLVIGLAAAFVLESFSIARIGNDIEKLEENIEQLSKNKVYLQSKITHIESLDHIELIASAKYGLKIPHPDQIVWLSDSSSATSGTCSLWQRTINRLGHLYADIKIPMIRGAKAVAAESGQNEKN